MYSNDIELLGISTAKSAISDTIYWYKIGFVLNPYDKCIANKTINGSQCTIVFYVDDNKISQRFMMVTSMKGGNWITPALQSLS